MNLFEQAMEKSLQYSPLAVRMRPRTLEEFEEQTEIASWHSFETFH